MKTNNIATILGTAFISLAGGMVATNQAHAHHIDLGWDSSPSSLRLEKSDNLGREYSFECVPAPINLSPTIYGSDNYGTYSDICPAAVHAGVITKDGGLVTFKINAGKEFYTGLNRNGFKSRDRGGSAFSYSFIGNAIGATSSQTPTNGFAGQPQTTGTTTISQTSGGVATTQSQTTVGQTTQSQTVQTTSTAGNTSIPSQAEIPAIGWGTRLYKLGLDNYSNQGKTFTFKCTSGPSNPNTHVKGTDSYDSNSDICPAAVHAGVITRDGGVVTLKIVPGKSFYTGSQRYGISTLDWGGSENSIIFLGNRIAGTSSQPGPTGSTPAPVGTAPRPGTSNGGAAGAVERGIEKGVQDTVKGALEGLF